MVEIIRNSIYKINTILKLRETYIERKLDRIMLEFTTELKNKLKIKSNILKKPNYTKFRKILVFYVSSLAIDSITLQIIEHIYANTPISMYDAFPRGFDGFYINTIYMELRTGNNEIIKVYNSLDEPTAEQIEIFET